MSDIFQQTRKLGTLKRRERILSRRLRDAKKLRAEQERLVHDMMLQSGFKPGDNDGLKLGGVNYSPQETTFAVIQDRDALEDWIRENGDESILDTRIKQESLNQMVREKLDNGEPLPPGLSYWDKTWVSTKGVKSSATTPDTATQEDTDE